MCVLSKNLRLRCEEMNSCAEMLQMEIFTPLVIFIYLFIFLPEVKHDAMKWEFSGESWTVGVGSQKKKRFC